MFVERKTSAIKRRKGERTRSWWGPGGSCWDPGGSWQSYFVLTAAYHASPPLCPGHSRGQQYRQQQVRVLISDLRLALGCLALPCGSGEHHKHDGTSLCLGRCNQPVLTPPTIRIARVSSHVQPVTSNNLPMLFLLALGPRVARDGTYRKCKARPR